MAGVSKPASRRARKLLRRRGASAIDYALVMGVIFPMAAFVLKFSPRIIRLVYEMILVQVSWPFM